MNNYDDTEDLDRRIENLERFVMGIPALLDGHLPPEANDALQRMAQDYFDVLQLPPPSPYPGEIFIPPITKAKE